MQKSLLGSLMQCTPSDVYRKTLPPIQCLVRLLTRAFWTCLYCWLLCLAFSVDIPEIDDGSSSLKRQANYTKVHHTNSMYREIFIQLRHNVSHIKVRSMYLFTCISKAKDSGLYYCQTKFFRIQPSSFFSVLIVTFCLQNISIALVKKRPTLESTTDAFIVFYCSFFFCWLAFQRCWY